jgi:small-conductance mechanosensitive channel
MNTGFGAWIDGVVEATRSIAEGGVLYIPNLLGAFFIFLLGWVIGAILGKVVDQFIKTVKLDVALKHAGIDEALDRGGFSLNSGAFIGGLVKWFVVIVGLIASLEILGLNSLQLFLQDVVLRYLPNVIVAVLILLAAAVIADVVQSLVVGSAKAGKFKSANLLGSIAKWSIWIFAILAALDQLNVASAFVQTLFTGIVIAVSLALGLAFGLGGQDAARDCVAKVRKEISHRND